MFAALASPFGAGDVHLRLTSLFGNEQKTGSLMLSLLHIDGRDLTFTDEADGWRHAVIDVAAYTFDENGNAVDSLYLLQTARLSASPTEPFGV